MHKNIATILLKKQRQGSISADCANLASTKKPNKEDIEIETQYQAQPTVKKGDSSDNDNSSAKVANQINNDEYLDVEFRVKSSAKKIPKVNERGIPEDEYTLHPDDVIAARFEEYGNTPPRTRMNKKSRDWDRKQKPNDPVPKRGMSRPARSRALRRNTMDCALLNEIFVDEEVKRSDKRSQALLRDAERDLKTAAINQQTRGVSFHEMNSETTPDSLTTNSCCRTSEVPTFIESCNRYMSVSSRPIGCRSSAPPLAFAMNLGMSAKETPALHTRKEFHETFANLIKLGSIDRQEIKPTQEEHTWQTEVKDLIWLELQACQADRTMEQQDRFLFSSRQGVPDLLNEIINYKFRPFYKRELSAVSTDSGLSTGSGSDATSKIDSPSVKSCHGCMSLYCRDCSEQQKTALKEVEELLTRLEAAEALYPSSQAMGSFHPNYKSESFVGRIKAMCLWYNITRQTRLKLMLLGKIFTRLQGEKFSWPVKTSTTDSSSSSSGFENDDSALQSIDSKISAKEFQQRIPKVQFQLDEKSYTTPSSSNDSTSTESSHRSEFQEFAERINTFNIFSVEPLMNVYEDSGKNSTTFYRKFIENVLKSKGLAKSVSFLQRLHSLVLHKAQISLEKIGTEDDEFEIDLHDKDLPRLEPEISKEQIEELRRYGYWSPESKSIGLPSYIPTFVFLSIIPLQFMHEFLRMRLETRPQKPNPLSLKQLMKELREGLTLALTHRENYHRHISTALQENEEELEKYLKILDQFDSTVKTTFGVYLDYVDQMVLEASSENNQKSALEKEWMFTKLVSPMIHGMHTLATKKFCLVIRKLLRNISERLINQAREINIRIECTSSHPEDKKKELFKICRETQCFFTYERERSLKVLFFAKTFCRDVEHSDFHREHYEEYLNRNKLNNFVCPAVKQEFKLVQKDVLDVRNRLKQIIEGVQEQCSVRNIIELDEQDRQAVFSGYREILHQGFKFGFEYNKDVIRLFEQKIMKNRDATCDKDLALGIVAFSKMWMQFVTERCERGRGVRPRWASQGLEFLILACDPQITRFLDDHQFEELKTKMDHCISHVIGINSEPEKTKKKASPRTRKTSSPATSRSRTPTRSSPMSAGTVVDFLSQKFLHPQLSLKEEPSSPSDYSSIDTPDCDSTKLNTLRLIVPSKIGVDSLVLRQIRVRDAVNRLDMEIENSLRKKNLIGQVKALNTTDSIQIRAKSVNFHWHRGIKIGQGRFGKVYTAVNNSTGELMAMKEIAVQPGETRALKNVADELKILEGITHRHLVRYYGIEVHREELLIFMELCSEGTLESLVEMSDIFPEGLTRRFTAQLLSGVKELHKHGIVHRDIKTANIFLVDESNSLKLGDFGSAVKIQAHTTVPGELQGYVGTQAYMAPEMFTKSKSDGHGRSADIWSVGCVVVEMASGKRPWWQYDSNFQIMFKVGMGEAPKAPDTLSQEGHDFLQMTLQHDPNERWSAVQLLEHNFCKVVDEDCNLQYRGRHSFRRSD